MTRLLVAVRGVARRETLDLGLVRVRVMVMVMVRVMLRVMIELV